MGASAWDEVVELGFGDGLFEVNVGFCLKSSIMLCLVAFSLNGTNFRRNLRLRRVVRPDPSMRTTY